MKHLTRRAAPLLAAAVCSLTLAAPALAAPVEVLPSPAVSVVEVDPAARGSLEVTAMANTSTTPVHVSGISFDLIRVEGVDLSTQSGWDRAVALIENPDLLADETLSPPLRLAPTDEQGRTGIADVAVGLYVLRQAGEGEVAYKDMIFTIPTMDTREGEELNWVYNLDLFPKPETAPEPTPEPTPTEPPTQEPTIPPTAPPPGETAPPATPGLPTGPEFGSERNWLLAAGGLIVALGGGALLTRRDRRGEHARN